MTFAISIVQCQGSFGDTQYYTSCKEESHKSQAE